MPGLEPMLIARIEPKSLAHIQIIYIQSYIYRYQLCVSVRVVVKSQQHATIKYYGFRIWNVNVFCCVSTLFALHPWYC